MNKLKQQHLKDAVKAHAALILSVLFTAFFVCGCAVNDDAEEMILTSEAEAVSADAVTESVSEEEVPQKPHDIYVYICGAIKDPGVYTVHSGSHVFEVIAKAGGLSEDADDTAVNQAEIVTDGSQITIPTKAQTEAGIVPGNRSSESTAAADTTDGRVNINTATADELTALSGIGMNRAEAIIRYRDEHGAFTSPEDIMNVAGIKEGLYTKIKDQIKL
ncbi:MAG: helix-hairpin-helix domain-containing protein [Lachnospiraceae bacterium]|nr:helix-hairpin-helix domain-containing protein [Lachnospiraceae bacterium]